MGADQAAMTTIPRIALQIDTATGYSSALIHGVVEHTRERRRWELLVQTRGSRERWRIPAHWRPDGVIARVTRRSQARELVRLGVPVVNVSRSAVPGFPFPQVTVDERTIGTWAADHLVERGFTHVAYVGLTSQAFYTDTCGPAFRERLARRLRIERVRELLRGTDWPMPRIAAAAGFSGAEVMNQVFRRELGRTPSAERRRVRSGVARAGGA